MESRIERLCVERGLKMTGQRRVIAQVLSEAEDHPDVEELYRRASALDGRISIATVYRTVRLLEENGILARRDFGGGRARYEPTAHGRHHHLIDIDTGRVIEFEDGEHERLVAEVAAPAGLRPCVPPAGAVRAQAGRQARNGPPGTPARVAARAAPRVAPGVAPRAAAGAAARVAPIPARGADGNPGGPVTADSSVDPSGKLRGSYHDGGPRSPFAELRAGALGLRIATSPAEIDAVQALRYRVFYEEMGAAPDDGAMRTRRDFDVFDTVADHLVVVDHAIGPGAEGVVGTYRMLQRAGAAVVGRFYSSDEYDIDAILRFPGRLLELGRSCVDANYRGRAVMQLLWRGIAAYVFQHEIDLLFGCASLAGTDPDQVAAELTYLHHNHLAPPALRPTALRGRYVDMRRQAPGLIDSRRVLSMLPPLIKGYLRMGAMIGDGAVIDHQFNTTDVAIVVKTDLVTDRYIDHYKRQMRD